MPLRVVQIIAALGVALLLAVYSDVVGFDAPIGAVYHLAKTQSLPLHQDSLGKPDRKCPH